MEKIEGSLAGNFLISTRKMPDPRFAGQVIYLCFHSREEGAMGVAINRPAGSVTLAEAFPELAVDDLRVSTPVYIGGPVEQNSGCILYERHEWKSEFEFVITSGVALTRERQVLEQIAGGGGPQTFLLLLGYAGWGPGQLEEELTRNGWLVVPGSEEIIFHCDNRRKWQAAAEQLGIDMNLYEDETGNA